MIPNTIFIMLNPVEIEIAKSSSPSSEVHELQYSNNHLAGAGHGRC